MIDLLNEILITAASLLFGSFVLSSAGFGLGLAAFPFILLIVEPKTAVVVVNTVSMVVFGLLVFQNRHKIKYKEMRIPISAGLLGVPVGLFFLDLIDPNVLSIVIAVLIVASVVFTTFFKSESVEITPSLFTLLSFLVGMVTVSTGIGGPLMAMVVVDKDWKRDTIRGSLALYQIFVKGVSVVGYFATQRFDSDVFTLTAVGVFPTVIGFLFASAFVTRIQEGLYRKLIRAIIITAGMTVLVKAVLQIAW